jgi:NADH-quinone oxidoreductase subunit G/NADP-reducing hydrogenase subunit HndD
MAINLTIDGIKTTAEPNETILAVAKRLGKKIPTLCFIEGLLPNGACRICVVDDAGRLVPSCATPVREGMDIKTNSAKVVNARKSILELLLAAHPNDCTTCFKSLDCELAELAKTYSIDSIKIPKGYEKCLPDLANPAIVREPEKCILCGKCVRVCEEIQNVGAIDFSGRGAGTRVTPSMNRPLSSTQCTFCGQCIMVCPTGALHEKSDVDKVINALSDPNRIVVVQTAPAIRVSIGEEFGMAPGTVVTGKLATALKYAGFHKVLDTDYGADLTIMEEGSELLHRLKEGGSLPLLTSCSPGWVKFIEHNYPELLPNVSSAKSPHEMVGAVVKNIWAVREGIDPSKVFVVSIMPCTAKKFEAARPELGQGKISDVDAVLTTREAAILLKQLGIDLARVPEGDFDHPLGESTGAAAIFGRSGGVMEAALRTAYYLVTVPSLKSLSFQILAVKA